MPSIDLLRLPCVGLFIFTLPPAINSYTLSLHDALPICTAMMVRLPYSGMGDYFAGAPSQSHGTRNCVRCGQKRIAHIDRSEEHTSELQSLAYLVCRLLLEKKKLIIALYLILRGCITYFA